MQFPVEPQVDRWLSLKSRSVWKLTPFLTLCPPETLGRARSCVEGEGIRRELQVSSSEPGTRALGLSQEPEADHTPLDGLCQAVGWVGMGKARVW